MNRELAFVALGSNLGDSVKIIRRAIRRLRALSIKPLLVSSLWKSNPVDCPPGSPPFINAVVGLAPRVGVTPVTLLRRLRALEWEFGRHRTKIRHAPRLLDLDLIAFGSRALKTKRLTLPHPRAHLRLFVVRPLAEIEPGFILPGRKKTVRQLARGLKTGERLRQL